MTYEVEGFHVSSPSGRGGFVSSVDAMIFVIPIITHIVPIDINIINFRCNRQLRDNERSNLSSTRDRYSRRMIPKKPYQGGSNASFFAYLNDTIEKRSACETLWQSMVLVQRLGRSWCGNDNKLDAIVKNNLALSTNKPI
jgi:hypothetical protein